VVTFGSGNGTLVSEALRRLLGTMHGALLLELTCIDCNGGGCRGCLVQLRLGMILDYLLVGCLSCLKGLPRSCRIYQWFLQVVIKRNQLIVKALGNQWADATANVVRRDDGLLSLAGARRRRTIGVLSGETMQANASTYIISR
jgi:hypothetical protein